MNVLEISIRAPGGGLAKLVALNSPKGLHTGWKVAATTNMVHRPAAEAADLVNLRTQVHGWSAGVPRTLALLAIDAAESVDQLGDV